MYHIPVLCPGHIVSVPEKCVKSLQAPTNIKREKGTRWKVIGPSNDTPWMIPRIPTDRQLCRS